MTESPTYEELEKKIKELEQEKTAFLHTETVLKKQVAKLTQPLKDDALRKSEKEYRATLDNLFVGVVVHAKDTSILFSNPRATNILGLTYNQMYGKKAIDPAWYFIYENLSIMQVADYPVCKVLSTKKPIHDFVSGIKRPDRKDITWVIINAIPLFSKDGEVEKVVVNFLDYTDRKKDRELLQRNQALLNTTQKLAKIGGWEIDLETKTTFWTDEVYQLHDLPTGTFESREKKRLSWDHDIDLDKFTSIDEAVKLSLKCYATQDRQVVIEAFRKCAEKGQPYDLEFPFTTTKGRKIWIRTIANPVMKGTRVSKVVGNFIDITDLKRAEEERRGLESQLHQAVKSEALGVLAGGIAHDFNNILSAILGYSQMAIDELSPSSSAYEDIQQVMASGNRAADLVKQILLFSRHEAEDFHPVRIQETIKEVVGMFRTSLPSSINFTESINWDCNSIHADPTQIHQIIMNLCTNARQAIKNDYGSISIALSEISPSPSFFSLHGAEQTSEKYACVEIRDSGCGIPVEIQSKIFDPFFTTKTEEKGTGLGLAVVDGIVRKHNGLITLESDTKTGTVFQIYLPIVELKNATVATLENLVPNGYERILLVDDELMLNDIHKRSLEKFGYHVTCFSDSLKAYNNFQKNSTSYDIVVTDMTMPNLTGLDLIKGILQINPDTKSILCTGYSKTVTEKEARSFGVNAYLPKPFRPLLLAETIRQVFDYA